MTDVTSLASYRHCVECIEAACPGFRARRLERLVPHDRNGTITERITDNILEDFFTLGIAATNG